MRININTIITLENETRYVVLNGTEYQGKKYFLVMEVDEKKEVIKLFMEEETLVLLSKIFLKIVILLNFIKNVRTKTII